MTFQDLNELPGWIKTAMAAVGGAGAAKLIAVWLENRRLEKKDYRDTLLGRIRELEQVISGMHADLRNLSVELALVRDENKELKTRLSKCEIVDRDVHPPVRPDEK